MVLGYTSRIMVFLYRVFSIKWDPIFDFFSEISQKKSHFIENPILIKNAKEFQEPSVNLFLVHTLTKLAKEWQVSMQMSKDLNAN